VLRSICDPQLFADGPWVTVTGPGIEQALRCINLLRRHREHQDELFSWTRLRVLTTTGCEIGGMPRRHRRACRVCPRIGYPELAGSDLRSCQRYRWRASPAVMHVLPRQRPRRAARHGSATSAQRASRRRAMRRAGNAGQSAWPVTARKSRRGRRCGNEPCARQLRHCGSHRIPQWLPCRRTFGRFQRHQGDGVPTR
jgi:hypothetical protein